MARPSRTSGKKSEAKTRDGRPTEGRKATKTKPRIAPATTRVKRRSISDPGNDLKEAREQQTATVEILRVISRSLNDTQPVFDAIVRAGLTLFPGSAVSIELPKDGEITAAAIAAENAAGVENWRKVFPFPFTRDYMAGVAMLDRRVVDVADAQENLGDLPIGSRNFLKSGYCAVTKVPMLRGDSAVGVISVARPAPGALTERQLAILTTFADQAVIAIENARLLNELREALQQQTATADVLKVISRSAFDLQPVLDTIVETASRLCAAEYAFIYKLQDDGKYHMAANHGADQLFLKYAVEHPLTLGRGSLVGRTALERKTVHMPDCLADPEYVALEYQSVGHYRSTLGVPLLREGIPIGVIILMRAVVMPFTERQIELVTTFADQAVIAIENVRLFDEVQARTDELRESLQQQTATADVLKVISRSTFDLQTVLNTLLESAAAICDADFGNVAGPLSDGTFKVEATYGTSKEFSAAIKNTSMRPGRGSAMGRALQEKATIHIHDATADPEYELSEQVGIDGFRTLLGIPLLREGTPIGVFAVGRRTVRPFTDKQIELVSTFADQAAIAIENVRLFNEVRDRTEDLSASLQQQTATSDVLKVISRSAFDLKTVLQTLLESAVRLAEADKGTITRKINAEFYRTETTGFSPEFLDQTRDLPVRPERGSAAGRALLEGVPVHILDQQVDPDYTFVEARKYDSFRTMLSIPLLREGVPLGGLTIARSVVRPFTEKQIELVTTFADQAAIAIENSRLFEEVQSRTHELSRSLHDLRTAQDRLVQTEKLASLGQLTAGIAHEIKNPLNFVNNFSALSAELTDELNVTLKLVAMDGKVREEVDELTGMLKDNLQKVVQHGKRADSIVKNMLLHSRESSREHRPADINSLLDESLNLAYHGARAENGEFNITLRRDFDADAGTIELFPQEITRALLNLIANGVYAATKRKDENGEPGFEPTLRASTRNLGTSVEIRIRDNGAGIPPEVQEKMFNPFFTTKPAGEGTGLGLSITHDIIVKQHGGRIDVATEPGQFTEFIIVLPRKSVVSDRERGET
jgi:two-component system NtrC family sensor kinase